MKTLTYLTFFSAICFLYFGWSCISTSQMRSEFMRYGLSHFREMVGILQLLGALGLVIGYFYLPMLQAIAAGGLSIIMAMGFIVRLKIGDTLIQSAPSLVFTFLNAYIFYRLIPFL